MSNQWELNKKGIAGFRKKIKRRIRINIQHQFLALVIKSNWTNTLKVIIRSWLESKKLWRTITMQICCTAAHLTLQINQFIEKKSSVPKMPKISVENTANYKPAFDRKLLLSIILLKAFTSFSPRFKRRGYRSHNPNIHIQEQLNLLTLHPSMVIRESK